MRTSNSRFSGVEFATQNDDGRLIDFVTAAAHNEATWRGGEVQVVPDDLAGSR